MSSILESFQNTFSLSAADAKFFIRTAPYRYKFHNIKKRHGGEREIAQPTKSLKIVQRWIINQYLKEFPVHDAATAYIKERSILNHASPHKSNKYLLKLDFKNFFNSINIMDFYEFINYSKLKMSEEDRNILGFLLFCKNKNNSYYLSIGAPSSPYISNIILYEFDCLTQEICHKNNVVYTRYADDLAFSTNTPNILSNILQDVRHIISSLKYPRNLELNQDKTVFLSRKHNRTLTGLVISNSGKISIGRDKKRKLRAAVHNATLGKLTDEEIQTLKGKIAFVKGIDKDFAIQLEQKLKP
ncbi:retron St85 family RNA-directed DNA polymerase [Capnocytophaga sp.]